jgi:hypothetical protein
MTAVLFFAGCQTDSEEEDPVVEPEKPVINSSTSKLENATYEKGATDVTAIEVVATVTDGGELTYQWYMSTTESAPGTPVTFRGPDKSYTPSTDTLGTRWYYMEVTNTKDNQTATTVSSRVRIGITTQKISFTNIQNEGYDANVISEDINAPWTLNAKAQGETYIGVVKTAAQIVGVRSGIEAARVRLVNSNDTINGELVTINGVNVGNDPRYAVFKVDTSDFGLLFDDREEKTLKFDLEVTEGENDPVPVEVTLKVAPPVITSDSITIFSVKRTSDQTEDEEGALTKINAKIAGQPVATLLDALKWINTNTADNYPEYLVRIEKDEIIPRVVLTCLDKPATIRLRGNSKEGRTITYDSVTGEDYSGYYARPNSYPSYTNSLITLGDGYVNPPDNITLQLEYIILDGQNNISSVYAYSMVEVIPGSTLIMKSGSKITGYNSKGSGSNYHDVICVRVDNQNPPLNYGKFILDGGEITGNTVDRGVIFIGGNLENNGTLPTFTYNSGKIHGNVRYNENDGKTGNYQVYAYDEIELEEEK